jgi:hypothetical protein
MRENVPITQTAIPSIGTYRPALAAASGRNPSSRNAAPINVNDVDAGGPMRPGDIVVAAPQSRPKVSW